PGTPAGCQTPPSIPSDVFHNEASPAYGPQAWGSVEYLLWFVTPQNVPPLIQTVPAAVALGGGTLPPGSAGTFFPTTRQLEFGAFSGVRGTAGYMFDRLGVEVSGFYLPQRTKDAALFSSGVPFSVAQPYISAGTGQPTSLFSSLAGQYTGGTTA